MTANYTSLTTLRAASTGSRVAAGQSVEVVPDDLAATGCVNSSNPRLPAAGVIPYSVNAAFWSDGAAKTRHLAVPNGTTISVAADGDWQFPAGSVLMKTMELAGKPVETRLLMRHPDGGWAGYTYEWDSAARRPHAYEAGRRNLSAVRTGSTRARASASSATLLPPASALGPTTGQLNGNQLYPATGRLANQLETLSHIGLVLPAIANPAAQLTLPAPTDGAYTLEQRARAYLDTNCANCHRPGGPTGVSMDLRYRVPLDMSRDTRTATSFPRPATWVLAMPA